MFHSPGPGTRSRPDQQARPRAAGRYVTPSEIRRAGKTRIANYLRGTGQYARSALEALVDTAVAAAGQQRLSIPGENTAAAIVKDLAAEH